MPCLARDGGLPASEPSGSTTAADASRGQSPLVTITNIALGELMHSANSMRIPCGRLRDCRQGRPKQRRQHEQGTE